MSKELGDLIRNARTCKLMSQKELAIAVGITQSSISSIERGEITGNIKTLQKICEVLNLNPMEALYAEGFIIGSKYSELSPGDEFLINQFAMVISLMSQHDKDIIKLIISHYKPSEEVKTS